MSASTIFLILVSGLGVLHGFILAIFLWFYSKKNAISNKILSLLLIVLSFRVGKSVLLEFVEHLDIQIIFSGLATLMAIGPLYHFYTKSLIQKDFQLKSIHLLHFIPLICGLLFGLWINLEVLNAIPKILILLIFATYYSHYLIYLICSYLYILKKKKTGFASNSFTLLQLLFFGLLFIWIAYVLNLFDEFIPYIIGPILYTLVAYTISLIIFKKGYLKKLNHIKYQTTAASEEQIDQIFSKLMQLLINEKQYKNGDLTLKLLSKQMHITPQTLSMVINTKNNTNFNNFINHYRIEEAIAMFKNSEFKNHTIASISFDSGFNSISSFNTAFKKHTKSTPTAFRIGLS